MDAVQRRAFLKTSKLFRSTPDTALSVIADLFREETFSRGQDIVRKGEDADRMFLVVSGRASVHEGARDLRMLEPGDGFGEMAMLDDQTRSATITALETVVALSLDRSSFRTLLESRPEVSQAILLGLTATIRSNTESMARDFEVRMELERRVQDHLRDLGAAQMAVIFALSKLSESRDTDTGLHLERVREYSRVLATELSHRPEFAAAVTDEFVELVYRASPLHDIGKVAIPDSILRKPGPLNPEEIKIMQTHAELGAQTLREVMREYPGNQLVSIGIEIAESHHERWDGTGYPRGRSGLGIPLPARIVAVADVYDALTSRRPYKEAFPPHEARRIIVQGRGTHFDPAMIDAFLTVEPRFAEIAETLADLVH